MIPWISSSAGDLRDLLSEQIHHRYRLHEPVQPCCHQGLLSNDSRLEVQRIVALVEEVAWGYYCTWMKVSLGEGCH